MKRCIYSYPITTDTTFTDSGYENETYTGKMMLLVSSNIDETYADADYIQPLMAGALATMKQTFICSDYDILKFQTTEVINLLIQI
jgi:hypothetical protein